MQAETTGGTVPADGRPAIQVDQRSARILARSIYRDMQTYGVPSDRILEVAGELIGLVTEDLGDRTA